MKSFTTQELITYIETLEIGSSMCDKDLARALKNLHERITELEMKENI